MKINMHKDGTYSITQMTRDDMSALSFGAMSAHAWYASPDRRWDMGSRDGSITPEWNTDQAEGFERLERALRRAADARQNGSLVLTSRTYGTTARPAYTVETRRGMLTWRESWDAEDAAEAERQRIAAE